MRIGLCCWGSYGDVFPYLAIATRLRAMGHDPVIATSAFHRERVERDGIRFHAVRPDIDPSDTALLARVMDPVRGTEVLIRELLVPSVRGALEDLERLARSADLIVSHPVTFAAPVAAESAGVPWISSVLAPASLFSAHDFPLLPPYSRLLRLARLSPWLAGAFKGLVRKGTNRWTAPVRALRREYRLKDSGNPLFEGQFSPHGTVALFSPAFGPPQADWPPRTVATGFPFYQDSETLPADVASFFDEGPAPVVFTLGSSAAGAAGSFYDESAKAAEMVGRRALLLVGRDPRNRSVRRLPPTICAAEYAPHRLVFAKAAAIVHHGGIGTTAQAMAAGKPMLVVPHAHDQPDNAFRATRLGVARTLSARLYTAARAGQALTRLLEDPSYRSSAARLAGILTAEAGVQNACEVILDRAEAAGIPRS